MPSLKTIAWVVLIAGVFGAAYFFLAMTDSINRELPLMLDDAEFMLREVCEGSVQCENTISKYYDSCMKENEYYETSISSFGADFMTFLTDTYQCIEEEAGAELPSLGDYLIDSAIEKNEN